MKKNKFSLLSKFVFLITIIYITIFINYHFYTPDIGSLDIIIGADTDNVETVQLTISPTKDLKHYYILLYEDGLQDNWLYFISNTYNKEAQHILDEILPQHTSKYVFVEGSPNKDTYTFTMKSKYPINHLTDQNHTFHAYLIVPYRIYPFPKFYYAKHQVFFINFSI
ncbi:hypothetical protein [Niameybacter massiliensis]|uniref:hypothetical protein n=1 Tax=Niameybacter massiliensis TaxID=1658108 RepID=UPI0006B5FDB9|nr:hypothetical protein [Niameybacter massiliensis]